MAKDQIEEQVERVTTLDITADETRTFLQSLQSKIFLGLTIDVETQGAVLLKGGEVSDVHIDSAWASFTYDGILLRTKKISDRNEFVSWLRNGGIEPFSTHRDFKDRVGPPRTCFMRIHGGN